MVKFVLVHGTFARDAAWTAKGSPFRERLRALLEADGLEVEYETFNWSGGNSHRARLKAARELSEFLQAPAVTKTNASPCIIVAHSHGGNVALLSQRHLDENDRIDGIVTLGTPFIYIGQSLGAKMRRWSFARGSGMLRLAFPILLIVNSLIRVFAFAGKRSAVMLMKDCRPPVVKNIHLLSVFYKQDEARAYLTGLALGGWFLDLSLALLAIVTASLTFVLVVFGIFNFLIVAVIPSSLFAENWWPNHEWTPPWMATYTVIVGLMALVVAVRFLSSLARSNPFGYGWGNPFTDLLLRVGVDYVPQTHGFQSKELCVFNWSESHQEGLSHSKYFSDDQISQRIAVWVRKHWRCAGFRE